MTPVELQEVFDAIRAPEQRPRFNISPSQNVAVIRQIDEYREWSLMKWGLIPHWAKDLKGPAPINARAETVAEKPMFKTPFKSRRCLVPADGFYEWQTIGKEKYPYFIHMKDDRPFAFAGFWNRFENGPETVESFALMTTSPNELMEKIHDRMPVILSPDKYELWLDPKAKPEDLTSCLTSYPASKMEAYQVSRLVNKPTNDVPQCVVPDSSHL